jgi:glycosyltransferase involved in cell wall biosynthesis
VDCSTSKKMMNTREISIEPNCVRVVNILTSSLTVRFLEGQPEYFQNKGFEIVIVSSPGEELSKVHRKGARTIAVPMAREMSPWCDLLSLWRIWRVLSRLRPVITNVATPKAGLLGGIAAWTCRVPCRYYTLIGLRCETTTGFKRWLLLLTERIACLCAHQVICVSESLRQKAIALGIVNADRTWVPGSGSCNGIDMEQFAPTAESLRRAAQLREHLGIPAEAPILGFVGRLTRDKGIAELVEAYSKLRERFPELRLLLVGEVEDADPLPSETRRLIKREPQIIHTGFVEDPVPYYHMMDVLAFPTHREGFPNAVLEAHAAGKPVVAARSTGVVDAVVDGATGVLVPVGDARALAAALELVLADKNLGVTLGAAGRERALREFRQEIVWDAIIQEYLQQLRDKGLSVPSPAGRPIVTTAMASNSVVSR